MLTDNERQPLDIKLKVADTPFLPKSIPFNQIFSFLGKDTTVNPYFMTRYYNFTEKARKENYDTDFFVRDADEIRKHHYCDDFSLYVSSYCVNEEGYLWEGNHDGMPIVRGITVSSDDDATIDWFVRTWVKLGYLEAIIPVTL